MSGYKRKRIRRRKKILGRWKEHFQLTLNHAAPGEENSEVLVSEDEAEAMPPGVEEIRNIIKKEYYQE